ncbi:unnamed protein product, partial [Brassica rapa]
WAKITRTVHGKGQRADPRTNVLICVLMDSHGRPVCADGHTQTHTDSHGPHMGQNHPNSPREGPAC